VDEGLGSAGDARTLGRSVGGALGAGTSGGGWSCGGAMRRALGHGDISRAAEPCVCLE